MTAGQTAPKPLCNSSCPMGHMGPISNKIDSKFAPKTNLLYRRSEHCSQWCSEGGYDLRYKRFNFGVLVYFRLPQEWLFNVLFSHFGHTRLPEFYDVNSTKLYANIFFPPASQASNRNFNSHEFLQPREQQTPRCVEKECELTLLPRPYQSTKCLQQEVERNMLLVRSTTGDMRVKMGSLLVVTTKDASISTSAAQLDSRRLGHKKKGSSWEIHHRLLQQRTKLSSWTGLEGVPIRLVFILGSRRRFVTSSIRTIFSVPIAMTTLKQWSTVWTRKQLNATLGLLDAKEAIQTSSLRQPW